MDGRHYDMTYCAISARSWQDNVAEEGLPHKSLRKVQLGRLTRSQYIRKPRVLRVGARDYR